MRFVGPWVNNCIGHHNHAHFIRFLFYVDIAILFHLYMISVEAFGTAFRGSYEPEVSFVIVLVANYATAVPVLLAVGFFSIFHFWCMASNTTTIEGWEKDKAATLLRRGHLKEFKYPYDLGAKKNTKSMLGDNMLWWCWPQTARGDGMHFETGTDVRKWLSSDPSDSAASPQLHADPAAATTSHLRTSAANRSVENMV